MNVNCQCYVHFTNVETLNTDMQLRGEMLGGTEFLSILTEI